jgi:8-oxo-dGTP pyrophosphatase MutT (NUDIX family)
MRFNAFEKVIPEINNLSLPGLEAQLKMAPSFRKDQLERYKEKRNSEKLAAVLALFYPNKEGDTNLVLILRKVYEGIHSAQVGFPGGKPEAEDESLQATAFRETWEEIGVSADKITVLRELSSIYIPVSNFRVHPFLGISPSRLSFQLQVSEVDAVVVVAVSDFLNDNFEVTSEVRDSKGLSHLVPAFKFNGHIVWGATAMVLIEIKTILNQVLKK